MIPFTGHPYHDPPEQSRNLASTAGRLCAGIVLKSQNRSTGSVYTTHVLPANIPPPHRRASGRAAGGRSVIHMPARWWCRPDDDVSSDVNSDRCSAVNCLTVTYCTIIDLLLTNAQHRTGIPWGGGSAVRTPTQIWLCGSSMHWIGLHKIFTRLNNVQCCFIRSFRHFMP